MGSSVSLHQARYLLDTNVISETRKTRPNRRVMQFIHSMARPILYISVLSIGELTRGAVQVRERDPLKASQLSFWIEELKLLFRGRILPINLEVAQTWGVLSSDRSRPAIDTLLASTAFAHGLTLVTRNVHHLGDLPISVLNPWDAVQ